MKTGTPTVGDFMTTDLFTLSPDVSIDEAVDFLVEHGISGAPVIDAQGKLAGVITEKDCLSLLAKGANHQRPQGVVEDFMTRNVHTIPPRMDIYFAAGLFLANPYRRFPVVEAERLVGIISRRDVLKALQRIAKARPVRELSRPIPIE
ncbi:MAG: CBS domain-containing protein [Myxococcales bacterium]|nr:CBS domain-containing protein [Myxococcales bacterium]